MPKLEMTEAEKMKAMRYVATMIERRGYEHLCSRRERDFCKKIAEWLRSRAEWIERQCEHFEGE